MKVQMGVSSSDSDERLRFIKQMGVHYVYCIFTDEDSTYDGIMRFRERLAKFDLVLTDGSNMEIYKNASFHLGLPDRDKHIDRYNELTRALGKAGVGVNFMAWQPDKVLTSRREIGQYTRGAAGRIVDIGQLKTLGYSHGRQFTEKETWDNFKYFLDRALPVCEEAGVRIALHPCDPPVPTLQGIYNLIHCSNDYRRAFELANDSPYLGIKFCIGCWLEGGTEFGNLYRDLEEFIGRNKVLSVHFRNVSSTHPYFEETLLEDGYMDMFEVMKKLVACEYGGVISVDHVPGFSDECGGRDSAFAYSTGYMKALLKCAEAAL